MRNTVDVAWSPRTRGVERAHAARLLRFVGAGLAFTGLSIIWVLRIIAHDRSIYVSGFGAQGEPSAAIFNFALATVGTGAILIAIATFLSSRATDLVSKIAALLTVGGVSFVLSAVVSCSPGCPVPFTTGAELRDVVHVALAVIGFASAGFAMLLSFRLGTHFSRIVPPAVVCLAVPVSAGALLTVLDLSHLPAGGWLELTATTVGLLWLIVFAVMLGRHTHPVRTSQS
ncbi:MAG: DUF998 domain-containing protein [Leucobacter sp.]